MQEDTLNELATIFETPVKEEEEEEEEEGGGACGKKSRVKSNEEEEEENEASNYICNSILTGIHLEVATKVNKNLKNARTDMVE